MNRDILSKRSPVREARLKLVIARLLITRSALRTSATAADETVDAIQCKGILAQAG
jgi:hypothetical protein